MEALSRTKKHDIFNELLAQSPVLFATLNFGAQILKHCAGSIRTVVCSFDVDFHSSQEIPVSFAVIDNLGFVEGVSMSSISSNYPKRPKKERPASVDCIIVFIAVIETASYQQPCHLMKHFQRVPQHGKHSHHASKTEALYKRHEVANV